MTRLRNTSGFLTTLRKLCARILSKIFGWLFRRVVAFYPWLKRWSFLRLLINKFATNRYANLTRPRPNTFSLWSDDQANKEADNSCPPQPHPIHKYMSWPALTDKTYFCRHLPPTEFDLPSNEAVAQKQFGPITSLFERNKDTPMREGRSNVMFMFFAQWFTDGFFRSDHLNRRKTNTNHNVDLVQIYGGDEKTANMLRSHIDGKLSADWSTGEELPDLIYEPVDGGEYCLKDKYKDLPYLDKLLDDVRTSLIREEQQKPNGKPQNIEQLLTENKPFLRATGLDRGNLTIGNLSMNTLFLREHNNICDAIKRLPEMQDNDERIFQTARMVNIVLLCKLTLEEYINHISGAPFLVLDNSFAEKQSWYREPWVAAEFNMAYRWHGLVPDFFNHAGAKKSFTSQYQLLSKGHTLGSVIEAALQQTAGDIGMGNTPEYLLPADNYMVESCREWKFSSFNDYREAFGLDRLKNFDQLTDNKVRRATLKSIYGHIDNLELSVGWYAEKKAGTSCLGALQARMVAYDAVTQIYANPLLAKKNYSAQNFTKIGIDRINTTNSLADLISRNIAVSSGVKISFDRPERMACPHRRPTTSTNLSKDKFRNILCPNLRVGVRMGLLNPNADGWITDKELHDYLVFIGLKPDSRITNSLVNLGEEASPRPQEGFINLTSLHESKLDHDYSTCSLDDPKGFNREYLEELKRFAVDGRMGTKEFADAANYFKSKNVTPVRNKLSGVVQAFELSSILEIFGNIDDHGKKYLSVDDIERLWLRSQFPAGWKPPVEPKIGFISAIYGAFRFAITRFLIKV